MSSLLKLRRGSTVAHETFTGAEGEVTFNTDTNALVTHDGATAGGFEHTTAVVLAASTGSSLVGHIASGSGAVATTVQTKLRESVSVKDFGAVGDGVTSDTAAIQAMFDAVASSGVKEIYFPPGTYLLPCNRTDADYTCAVVIRGLKNVVVRGARGTKFTQNTSGTGPSEYGMFRVEECVGVTFTGFEMDGSGIVTTGTGANRSRGFLLATIDVNNKAIDLAPNQRLEFFNIYAHDIGGFILYALRQALCVNDLLVHHSLIFRSLVLQFGTWCEKLFASFFAACFNVRVSERKLRSDG